MNRRAPTLTSCRASGAFTFIETLCILLVVSSGLLGILGLVKWGMTSAAKAQGRLTGLATAVAVANDPQPMRSIDWTYTPYAFDDTTSFEQSSSARGFLNGYWVERTETSKASDVIAAHGGQVYMRSALVRVEVFASLNGTVLASYQMRVVRQRGQP